MSPNDSPEARLLQLGYMLPKPPEAVASYVPCVRTGNQLYISGQLPLRDGALARTGHVGRELNTEEAAELARLCALGALAIAKKELGDLSRIVRVVKLNGFVACVPEFTDQPKVINGASDLLMKVLGEAGRHARSSVGVAALPLGAPVEIDFLLEVAP